ncbi:hypothetical protein HYFRA_00009092 [Hymenoscyphus fraxineus]|uniref:Uncharacterized protein n=1 Tax=Hymenoscyphus fraxineus TaxID=746836 RepID=A0A9N9PT04_9HELO|nr:hypothetical protein HYFRA_00009092 [Hymenoscyphus fraxineus]
MKLVGSGEVLPREAMFFVVKYLELPLSKQPPTTTPHSSFLPSFDVKSIAFRPRKPLKRTQKQPKQASEPINIMNPSNCPTCGNQTTHHHQYCAKFKDFLEKHPCPLQDGSTSFKLAVQLEEEATEFGLIWLACKRREGDTAAGGYDEPNLDMYLQHNYAQASPPQYEPLKLTNIPNNLNHSIELWDHFDSSTAKPNSLAQSFSGGERGWRGPILIASSVIVGGDVDTRNYMNVTPSVAEIAFAYLRTNGEVVGGTA